MKTYLMLGLLCGMTNALVAAEFGSIEITGRGQATSKPEFARLSMNVTSICYETSRAAKDANALLANRLVDIAKRFARGERDKVTTTGGASVRQTEHIHPSGSTTAKILCERKWRTTNVINIDLEDFATIPGLQDEVLKAIDAEGPVPTKDAQTFGDLSQPHYRLYPATATQLRTQAQGRAMTDAKAQLEAFKAGCTFLNLRLVKISEPQVTIHPKFAGEAKATTPLIPDDLAVQAVWKFVWEFDPNPECVR